MSEISELPQLNRRRVLESAVRAVARRVRLQRAIDATATYGLVAGISILVAALVHKMGHLGARGLWVAVGAAAGGLLVVALLAYRSRLSQLLCAQILDRRFGLKDRTGSALDFAARAASHPEAATEFEYAVVRDAIERVRDLNAAQAFPLRPPRDAVPLAGMLVAVGIVAIAHVPRAPRAPTAQQLAAIELVPEDLDAYREFARELERQAHVEDQRDAEQAAHELNRLLEDLADRRLDRAEAFRRLDELERRFLRNRPDQAELGRQLERLASELNRSELARETARALQKRDLREAQEKMKKLAQAVRPQKNARPDARRMQELREALERAVQRNREQNEQRQRELERARQEEQSLLHKNKNEKEKRDSEAERRLLKQRRREVERLEREERLAQERRRRVERLERDLEQAAQDLNRNAQDQASQDLDQAAEDLNRFARDQESEEQLARMMERMEELREMMRRQGRNGQGGQQQGRIARFYKLARGQDPGDGQSGQGQQPGDDPNQVFVLGPNGDKILMVPGQRPGGVRIGQGQGDPNRPGGGIGTQHQPLKLGNPSAGARRTQDVQVQGDQREGASRSEVILESANRGFASRGYRRVYTDYRTFDEDVLRKSEIPPGYRFYVRRYLDRIRPQEP